MKDDIKKSISESIQIIKTSVTLVPQIENSINQIISCLKNGNKVVLFGNGGSAADAQHIASEFIGRFMINRKSFPAIALTTDSSVITSLSNDFSYDNVFSRQIESLVNTGDIAIGISTSGNSKNVKNGIISAKKKGAFTIGLLGNEGGQIKKIVDISLVVNSSLTPRIQEVHRVIYHIICELVEKKLS